MEEWIKVQKSSDEIKLIQYLELLKLIIRQLEDVKSYQKSQIKVEEQLSALTSSNHAQDLKIGELLAMLNIKDEKIKSLEEEQQNKLSEQQNKIKELSEQLKQKDEKIITLYEDLSEQIAKLGKNNQLDMIEKLYTRLIQNDEREVNRKIREYTVNSKHSDPIRFVPTVTKPTYASVPHIGLFSSLINK